MIEFDLEVFKGLCEKYGVVMSDEYDQPMFKQEDGKIVPLTQEHIKKIIQNIVV